MTHYTSCEVKEEFRDDMDEIAALYWDDKKVQARDMAEQEMGWELIGGGMGRDVYRVSHEHQAGPVESATEEAPCIVKFPKRARHDGKKQNSGEISQFERFPDSVFEDEPPAVVPLSDWADDRASWLSMPEVPNPEGGFLDEAERKLLEHNWTCGDMHIDNVGAWHNGESVILDYGLECYEEPEAHELAREIADHIEDEDTEIVEVIEESPQEAVVDFRPPAWFGTGQADKPSSIIVDRERGPVAVHFRFGKWPAAAEERIEGSLDEIADRIHDRWHEVHFIGTETVETADGIDAHIDVELEMHRGEKWDSWMFGNFYEYVIEAVEEFIEDARDPMDFIDSVEAALGGEGFGGRDVEVVRREKNGGDGRLVFLPSSQSLGFADPPGSEIIVNGGFQSLQAVFGPWRTDSALADRIPSDTEAVIDAVATEWDGLNFTWRRYEPLETTNGVVAEITATPAEQGDEDDDAADMNEDEIARLYRDVLQAARREYPAAEQTGQRQEPLDEFIEGKIDAAFARLGLDGGTHAHATSETAAETLAVDVYDHMFGDTQMDSNRVNAEIASMVQNAVSLPQGWRVTVESEPSPGRVVLLNPDDETVWGEGYWNDVVKLSATAPPERGRFINDVSSGIQSLANDAIHAVERELDDRDA